MLIDFSELKGRADSLETIAREILARKGFVALRSGVGPDGGKDLRFKEIVKGPLFDYERIWVVQCKYKSSSSRYVAPGDFKNESIRQIIERNKAQAYLLVTTSRPTTTVQANIDSVAESDRNLLAITWDRAHLEQELCQHVDIFKEYFPKSYRNAYGSSPSRSRRLLHQFPNIDATLSPHNKSVGEWEVYYRGRMEGRVTLKGQKTKLLVLRSKRGQDFSLRVPRWENPLGLPAGLFRVKFKTSQPIQMHLFVIAEDRKNYFITYRTSDGKEGQVRDGQGTPYANYPIGKVRNNRKWQSVERDLNTDLEKYFQTRVLLVEHMFFNVSEEAHFKDIEFLRSRR